MYEDQSRRTARSRGRKPRHNGGVQAQPDRVALWAVFMAVIALLAAAATSARGADGGVGGQAEPVTTERDCNDVRFGKRKLAKGDCGTDVKTLNWILKSQPFVDRNPVGKKFKSTTHRSVKRFQRKQSLGRSGVVDRRTKRKLVRSMDREVATWYGPGLYGNSTACGKTLRPKTMGVAHRTLPCGTRVAFKYGNRYVRTRVIDRGPYTRAEWDLTERAAKKLGFKDEGIDTLGVAVAR